MARRWTVERGDVDRAGSWTAEFELDDGGDLAHVNLTWRLEPAGEPPQLTRSDFGVMVGYERLKHFERAARREVAATPGLRPWYAFDPDTGEEIEPAAMVRPPVARSINGRRRGHGVRIDPAFLDEVLDAWSSGASVAKLAEHYEVDPRTVSRWLQRARGEEER